MESLLNHPWPLGLLTGAALSLTIELGYQTAIRTRIQENSNRKEQMTAVRDGLFLLVSLLLGFTLALAAPRFADRRLLLIEEANAIGTTYLRANALPQPYRDQTRQRLRDYVDSRLDVDKAGLDERQAKHADDQTDQIQEQLWEDTIQVTNADRSPITALYMNSLNEMIDLHEKRTSSLENRIPRSVWLLIFSVSAIAVFTRGLTLASRFWLTLLLMPLTIAIVVTLIADLDTPSSGLIRLDQRALERLKVEMNSTGLPSGTSLRSHH